MICHRRNTGTRVSPFPCLFALLCLSIGAQASAGHNAAANSDQGYSRTVQSYSIPDVTLRNSDDEKVRLRQILQAGDKPVLLQFIFTSCQTVCPMLTAIMSQAQHDLRQVASDTRIVSISIDPEHDTPVRMRRYAEKYDAQGDWIFLTGDWDSIRKTLNAFDAMYEGGSKMYHKPYTFMRKEPGTRWVRLIGMMGAKQLVGEYSTMWEQRITDAASSAAITP